MHRFFWSPDAWNATLGFKTQQGQKENGSGTPCNPTLATRPSLLSSLSLGGMFVRSGSLGSSFAFPFPTMMIVTSTFIDNEQIWPGPLSSTVPATTGVYTALPLQSAVLSLGTSICHPMRQLSDGSCSLSPAILTSYVGVLCLALCLRPLSNTLYPCLVVLDSY